MTTGTGSGTRSLWRRFRAWLRPGLGRWFDVVKVLVQDPDAVPPDPTQTFVDQPGLPEVLAISNDAGGTAIVGLPEPSGADEATRKSYVDAAGPFFVGATDPASPDPSPAIGAGAVWVELHTSPDESRWRRRNAADTGWEAPFLVIAADGTRTLIGDGTTPLLVQNGNAVIELSSNGTIDINEGSVIVDPNAFTVTVNSTVIDGSGNIIFGFGGAGLPSSDPEVAGKVYSDGAIAPGVPQPLMVSGGPA